jgi:hypothetical protein
MGISAPKEPKMVLSPSNSGSADSLTLADPGAMPAALRKSVRKAATNQSELFQQDQSAAAGEASSAARRRPYSAVRAGCW